MATPPDFSVGQVLTAAQMNAVGLWKVADNSFTTISSASPLALTGIWSSTYDNYRVELEWIQNTAQAEMRFQLRDSGGTIATNYGFTTGGSFFLSGTSTFGDFNSSANETQTYGYIISCTAASRGVASIDVFGPNLARPTHLLGHASTGSATATITRCSVMTSSRHTASTVCTGLTLFPSAGTATGTIRVYGYRN